MPKKEKKPPYVTLLLQPDKLEEKDEPTDEPEANPKQEMNSTGSVIPNPPMSYNGKGPGRSKKPKPCG